MLRKLSAWIGLLLVLTGCTARFVNLTPKHLPRNADNLYRVEVALQTRQKTLRWHSIHPTVVMGPNAYAMRPTPLMTNRWETLVPVPPQTNLVHYRFKFDFEYNAVGGPRPDSAISHSYILRIVD